MTRHTFCLLSVSIAGAATIAHSQSPRTHRLEATPETVAYGYYWSEAKPVLKIASGDIIDVDTLLTNSPMGLSRAGVPDDKIQASLKAIVAAFPNGSPGRGPGGHILTGPVYVEGAEPGDTLEVKVLSIDLAIEYGYNGCSGFVSENCDKSLPAKILQLDRATMTAEFMPGIVIPLKPFFGSMGVAPAPELGRVSSNPPGKHAGNLDNRELVAGSTLYIPVFVPGALFEIGDGHAAQGDGEVCGTAIETPMRATVRLTVRKDVHVSGPEFLAAPDPNAELRSGRRYATDGIGPDLMTAARDSLRRMIDWLGREHGLSAVEAYLLCSVAIDLRISEIVDVPNFVVTAHCPLGMFD
jgi:acetamidase/formamidase